MQELISRHINLSQLLFILNNAQTYSIIQFFNAEVTIGPTNFKETFQLEFPEKHICEVKPPKYTEECIIKTTFYPGRKWREHPRERRSDLKKTSIYTNALLLPGQETRNEVTIKLKTNNGTFRIATTEQVLRIIDAV